MNKTDFTVFPSGRKDLIFHKKKKEKRREDPSGNGESEIERNDLEKLGRTWLGKFNELVPRSFLLFHFHLETVEEPSSEGLRGAARCETGAQKRSFTRGNDAREKEKKVGGEEEEAGEEAREGLTRQALTQWH